MRLDPYYRLDVSGQLSVWVPKDGRPGLDLSLELENLTDQSYQEVFGFRAPGRGVYVGARLRLGR